MNDIITLPSCPNPKVPPVTHPFRVGKSLQLRFNDIDMLGHINNGAYLQFLDLGKLEYFKTVLPSRFSLNDIYVVVVNVNCSFFSPGYMDEPLAVYTACTHLSQRSLILDQRVVNTATGDVKCVAQTVMAGFDPHTLKGIELDAEWAEEIAKFENLERKL